MQATIQTIREAIGENRVQEINLKLDGCTIRRVMIEGDDLHLYDLQRGWHKIERTEDGLRRFVQDKRGDWQEQEPDGYEQQTADALKEHFFTLLHPHNYTEVRTKIKL